MQIEPIAHIHTGFSTKFGIPRQSGLVPSLRATIVFEPAYAVADALRGLEGFSHVWLIWGFSENKQRDSWQPMVHPPRLGGNTKMGVFATRSPYRPNSLGLSSVELESIETLDGYGTVLVVRGADLLDGTPIYDIKPYVPYTDAHPDARGGFAADPDQHVVSVECASDLRERMGDAAPTILDILKRDPRPAYHDDPEREYALDFDNVNVRFTVAGDALTVVAVRPSSEQFRLREW